MLTPVEIQSKTFKSGGLGYDKKDVESFMREVLKSYEELYRQNMEQRDKISTLNEGIQYYKTIEKTLQKALVLAEKTAEETKLVAQKEAKRIEKEAMVKANIMLADAKNELVSLHNQTIALIQQYEKYKAEFRHLAEAQMELLSTDAFNINVARLDAFIDVEGINAASMAQNKNTEDSDEAAAEEAVSSDTAEDSSVEELTAESLDSEDTEQEAEAFAADYRAFDISNYEVDGQEEFDYLDLTDPES